jgi:signal transduction histidine kinase
MIAEFVKQWVRNELWDQVPVAISVIDRQFRIIEANSHFHQAYGDWQARPCYTVYKGREERCENCAAALTFADGKVRVRQEKGLVRDGEQTYYFVHMVPLIREGGEIPCIVEMSTDITLTKRLEHDKLEAERLAAVGQTVAGLAHGIKNVLMGIEGGMYVLRSGIEHGKAERILQGLQMLDDGTGRITFFVREFLEFARGRVPEVQLIDPGRVVRKVFDVFRERAARAGIALKLEAQADIRWVLMDENGIHDCLANLVSNAMDACAISDKPDRTVTMRCFEKDSTLVIEVADNGAGMDYEVKKKIFTSFFSTKGSDKGTGLGLLTTRKIVQEHGGKVSFESTEGIGSSFRLEFPRDRLPQPKETEPKAQEA